MVAREEGGIGTRVPVSPPSTFTGDVLTDVVLERHRQVRLWGHNEDTPNGTGPDVSWAEPWAGVSRGPATTLEQGIRASYDMYAQDGGELTFRHFLLEEMAEAFCEDDPDKLYAELVQVAAVAVSWCEKLRARRA